MKLYDPQTSKINDIFTVIDAEYLLKTMLLKRSEFSTDIKLSDEFYKVLFKFTTYSYK